MVDLRKVLGSFGLLCLCAGDLQRAGDSEGQKQQKNKVRECKCAADKELHFFAQCNEKVRCSHDVGIVSDMRDCVEGVSAGAMGCSRARMVVAASKQEACSGQCWLL